MRKGAFEKDDGDELWIENWGYRLGIGPAEIINYFKKVWRCIILIKESIDENGERKEEY